MQNLEVIEYYIQNVGKNYSWSEVIKIEGSCEF